MTSGSAPPEREAWEPASRNQREQDQKQVQRGRYPGTVEFRRQSTHALGSTERNARASGPNQEVDGKDVAVGLPVCNREGCGEHQRSDDRKPGALPAGTPVAASSVPVCQPATTALAAGSRPRRRWPSDSTERDTRRSARRTSSPCMRLAGAASRLRRCVLRQLSAPIDFRGKDRPVTLT